MGTLKHHKSNHWTVGETRLGSFPRISSECEINPNHLNFLFTEDKRDRSTTTTTFGNCNNNLQKPVDSNEQFEYFPFFHNEALIFDRVRKLWHLPWQWDRSISTTTTTFGNCNNDLQKPIDSNE